MDAPDKKAARSRPIPKLMYRIAAAVQPWQLRHTRFFAGVHLVLGCLFVGASGVALMHHVYWVGAILPVFAVVNFAYGWLLLSL